jgi:transposase
MSANIARKGKVVYKKYNQKQVLEIPIRVSDFIPEGHLVRIIDSVVENIAQDSLDVHYVGGGSSSYHPKMLLKVWLYGYCDKTYTSRPLAKAMRENLHYIWLGGGNRPCFKTLSSFRSGRLQLILDILFREVLFLLVKEGYIKLEDFFTDGTKLEANANKYKVVWGKNTARYKEQVLSRIDLILEELRRLQSEEDSTYGNRDLSEVGEGKNVHIVMTSEEVQSHLKHLDSLIASAKSETSTVAPKVGRTLASLQRQLSKETANLEKYEGQEAILAGRNSYSKTDPDATALRLKDEQVLPAYNIQHTTENQFITNYTVAQNASDSPTLVPHLDKMAERYAEVGRADLRGMNGTLDAGYGSEENYAECEKRGIVAYMKYPLWYQEVTGELAKKKYHKDNWAYDEPTDTYTCPNQRTLHFKKEELRTTATDYIKKIRIYECESCDNCPFALDCRSANSVGPRTVSHSEKGEVYKDKARVLLDSDKGKELRKLRCIEVETAFGDVKYNMKIERFILRGKEKVYVEYGLIALAHNLRKVYCDKSGIWRAQYAQRKAKKEKNKAKAA